MDGRSPNPVANAPAVLVIDDEEGIRSVLEATISRLGWTTAVAGTAEEALTLLAERSFDVLLVDKNLPGMNGVELIREVRRHDQTCVCMIITGYASVQSALQTLEIGIDGYLEKPFRSITEIVARVEEALKKRRDSQAALRTMEPEQVRRAVAGLRDPRQTPQTDLGVLVVCPSDDDRAWLESELTQTFLAVQMAASCEQGHSFAEAAPPSLVIVDVALPARELADLAATIRRRDPAAVVLGIKQGALDLDRVIRLIDVGIHGLIERPLDSASFRARVEQALARLTQCR